MRKIHLIGWAFLLILISASALTITVETEIEANTRLNAVTTPSKGNCEVLRIEKTVSTIEEVSTEPYTVTYELWYITHNENKRDVNSFETSDIDDKALETSVALACNNQWNQVTQTKANEEPLTIKIVPENKTIFDRIYDTITQTWSNKLTGLGQELN